MKTKTFDRVKVGDELAIEYVTGSQRRLYVLPVTHVTKTMFAVETTFAGSKVEHRFRRFDGHEPGKWQYAQSYWRAKGYATKEDGEEVRRQTLQRRAIRALDAFVNDKKDDWSIERSEAALKFCNEWGLK